MLPCCLTKNELRQVLTKIKVLEKLIEDLSVGKQTSLSPKSYKEITGAIQITASRDIKALMEMGCIEKVEGKGGRSASYVLVFEQ